MGMFDDLIPQGQNVPTSDAGRVGMFDDLIPQQKPAPEVVKRGTILPFVDMSDGTAAFGAPEWVAGPARALKGFVESGLQYQPGTGDESIGKTAADAAEAYLGLAVPGSRFAMPSREALREIPLSIEYGPARKPIPQAPRPALGGQPVDELAAALERQQMDMPRAAATDSLLQRQMGAGLAIMPIVGDPLVSAGTKSLDDLGRRVTQIADDAGGGATATRQAAGQSVRDDVAGWIKEGSKAEGNEIFRDVNTAMVGAEGRLPALKAALEKIEQEAGESKLDPPPIVTILWPAANAEQGLSFEGVHRLRQEIGDRLSGKVTPEPGQNERALKQIYGALSEDLRAMAGGAGERMLQEQMGPTVARARSAAEAELRERVKRPTKAAIAKAQDAGEAAFRETTEFVGMRDRAHEQGIGLWDAANERFAKEIAGKRDQLVKVVGAQGDADAGAVVDRLIAAAGSKQGTELTRLIAAKQVVGKEAWGELASSVIMRLGDTKDGFSPAVFRTNWHKLSDEGKGYLFSAKHKADLDDIATISQRFEQLQKLGNPSGTMRMGSVVAAATSITTLPLTIIGSVVGGRILARWLAEPIRAREVRDFAAAYVKAAEDRSDRNLRAYGRAAQALAAAAFEDRQKEASNGPN